LEPIDILGPLRFLALLIEIFKNEALISFGRAVDLQLRDSRVLPVFNTNFTDKIQQM
jgi:hypothetical protein